MADYSQHPRVLRLREIFDASGCKNPNAFAKSVGALPKTTYNYINGERVPDEDFLSKVVSVYPIYNFAWLMTGIGDKYNSERVSYNNDNRDDVHSNYEKQIKSLYESLIESLRQQIRTLTESCKDKQAQIDILKEMIEISKGNQ